MKVALANINDIPEKGEGTKVVDFFGRDVHLYKVDGVPKAALGICMHFGGQLACQDGKFVCGWHNAEFAMDDGHRLSGPAPSNSKLMFLSTREEEGMLNYVWGE